MRRVVITGMGAINALGHNAADTWREMLAGRSAIGPIQAVPAEKLRAKVAAEVRDYDPAQHFDDKRLPILDRTSQFAVIAAREAVRQSGIDFDQGDLRERSAVIVGTGVGGETSHDEAFRRLYGDNNPRVHPFTIVRVMANAPACHLSIEFGLTGPAFGVVSACASSNHAFSQALQTIRAGGADVALAGGAEACITLGLTKAWEAMRVLADDTCRPFCLQRRGLVLGEGAAIFVLEEYERARRRGATILAELAGAGLSADASDLVLPSQAGAVAAMRRALKDAGLPLERIGYINAHGTATPANDPSETRAIRETFGALAPIIPISSTKAMHGHALGAAGALEMVAALGALREQAVPPTANFLDPDPQCDLDYVPNVAREAKVSAVLSNSFAFGGLNAVIAVKRAE
ncbi:beta-ketoacyl-[acyl-carrier-protein] synthase family protein [Lysobacter sp. K5869]|uniref:beta-ketoacyl-[acyl-carrier-protein] synthase family protein n=1 Tax=Lysobacter sp. K5869 TaxID=2820808 RepID=UPI001C063EAE|nr:beta-ketoacyl-[acyl-carrier-protein] synthase family protein [Lysobacter sp. K5869]QWP77581.1 beta-ketoacyl-[acyl-carrier-protein] synthase family protein [Lysobacter sp. K5869]